MHQPWGRSWDNPITASHARMVTARLRGSPCKHQIRMFCGFFWIWNMLTRFLGVDEKVTKFGLPVGSPDRCPLSGQFYECRGEMRN